MAAAKAPCTWPCRCQHVMARTPSCWLQPLWPPTSAATSQQGPAGPAQSGHSHSKRPSLLHHHPPSPRAINLTDGRSGVTNHPAASCCVHAGGQALGPGLLPKVQPLNRRCTTAPLLHPALTTASCRLIFIISNVCVCECECVLVLKGMRSRKGRSPATRPALAPAEPLQRRAVAVHVPVVLVHVLRQLSKDLVQRSTARHGAAPVGRMAQHSTARHRSGGRRLVHGRAGATGRRRPGLAHKQKDKKHRPCILLAASKPGQIWAWLEGGA